MSFYFFNINCKRTLPYFGHICVKLHTDFIKALCLSCQRKGGDIVYQRKSLGSITIRRTAIPSMLVHFSTFEFLLNFSFMKYRKHFRFGYRDHICITNINNRDFYVYQGISLYEYIEISFFFS